MNISFDTASGQAASFDLAFPSIPTPAASFFAVAGEAALRALVWRHHERLRDSSIGYLFPAEPKRFAAVGQGGGLQAALPGALRFGSSRPLPERSASCNL